jgi:hypothetical protein
LQLLEMAAMDVHRFTVKSSNLLVVLTVEQVDEVAM